MGIFKTLLFMLPLLFASCAKSIVVNYSDDTSSKGSVVMLPSKPLFGSSLTVNGKLLVEQKAVRRITVKNLPDGNFNYHLTCDNSRFQEKADVDRSFEIKSGAEKTILIETPPYSGGYWVYTGLATIGSWVALYVFLSLD